MSQFLERYRGMVILAVIIAAAIFFCGILPNQILPSLNIPQAARPVIQLPGEVLTEEPVIDLPGEFNDIYITNTLVATFLVDILLILAAVIARIGIKEIPQGFYNLIEMLLEMLYNLSEQVVGNRVKTIFPLVTTIFLFILTANWMEMIPGVDSIGIMHAAHEGVAGHPRREVGNNTYILDVEPGNAGGVDPATLLPNDAVDAVHEEEEGAAEGEHIEEGAHAEPAHGLYVVTPFVRPATTDINTPLGLSVVVFVAVQIFGLVGLGTGYVAKFINTPGLKKGGMGIMDFGVGLLELVLEPFKMVSLTFRLLGNIFGGAVLLFVVSTLIPFLVPVALYSYELFVGAIQAYVFFMLTLVYVNIAVASHGDHDEEHH